MRKLLLFLTVVGLLAFLGANASSAAAGDVHATGAGWVSFPPFTPKQFVHFDVSAHDTPDQGQVGFTINEPTAPLAAKTDLDCVDIFPFAGLGVALAAGTVTKASPQPNVYGVTPGDRLEFYFVDGGNPSSTTPVDEFQLASEFAPCETIGFVGYVPNVTQGNIDISTG